MVDSITGNPFYGSGSGRSSIYGTQSVRFYDEPGYEPRGKQASAADCFSPAVSWDELNRARFICWLCTSQPEDELPLRFHPWDAARIPAVGEEGSVTITMHEVPDA